MTALSDRQADAFDNVAKSAYRREHLQVVRLQAPELWDEEERPHLRGAWLELMGATGWRTLELLLEAGALTREQFIGVDLDPDRIADYRTRFPGARWLAGDLLDLVDRPELEDVTVVHFDAYNAVASPRLEHISEQLSAILRRAVERFGAALLAWNADLDAARLHKQAPATALRSHAHLLTGLLTAVLGARRVLGEAALLPAGAEHAASALDFVGALGAFQVYRGKANGHRMACLRLVLR